MLYQACRWLEAKRLANTWELPAPTLHMYWSVGFWGLRVPVLAFLAVLIMRALFLGVYSRDPNFGSSFLEPESLLRA